MARVIDRIASPLPRFGLVLLAMVVTHFASAQESDAVRDFGIWVQAEYGTEIINDLDLEIEQEFRFDENGQQLGRWHTNIGLGYALTDFVRFGANYRFIANRRNNGMFAFRDRVTADIILRHRIKQWRFTYRSRAQLDFRGYGYGDETHMPPARKFRNKLQVQYQLTRRTAIYGDFNIRILVFDPGEPEYEWDVNRFRYRAGVKYLTSEYGTVSLFFQHDRDVNVAEPDYRYIVGIGFGLENWKSLF